MLGGSPSPTREPSYYIHMFTKAFIYLSQMLKTLCDHTDNSMPKLFELELANSSYHFSLADTPDAKAIR